MLPVVLLGAVNDVRDLGYQTLHMVPPVSCGSPKPFEYSPCILIVLCGVKPTFPSEIPQNYIS